MTTIELTPSQKNASQDAMRSLEEIKQSLSSEQYRLLCKGLQVPFTIQKKAKKINTEIWRCQVFEAVLVGFKHYSKGCREVVELNAESCIDYDDDDFEKFQRIFFQPKLKISYMNIEIRFVEIDCEDIESFPPPQIQPVLKKQKLYFPVPSLNDYQNNRWYTKIFQKDMCMDLSEGTHMNFIQKISEKYDTGDVEIETLLRDDED